MTEQDLRGFLQNVETAAKSLQDIEKILEGIYGAPDDIEFYYSDYVTIPASTQATLEFQVSSTWEIYAKELYVDGYEDTYYRWTVVGEKYDSNVVRFFKLRRIPTFGDKPSLVLDIWNQNDAPITLTVYVMGVRREKRK